MFVKLLCVFVCLYPSLTNQYTPRFKQWESSCTKEDAVSTMYENGAAFVKQLQDLFEDYSEWMMLLSRLGDPRYVFLVYFPLSFFLHTASGIRVICLAALSDSLNAISKWFLFGERPYWWVKENSCISQPELTQYKLTCEVGPGNPSGHTMITGAAMFAMASAFCRLALNPNNASTPVLRGAVWTVVAGVLTLIGVSRCFLATHFPHQVLAGVMAGFIFAWSVETVDFSRLSLAGFCKLSVSLLLIGGCAYWLLVAMGYDPMWTQALATKWCINKNWIHLDTNAFSALVRDSSCVLGVGLGLACKRQDSDVKSKAGKILGILLSMAMCFVVQSIDIPQDNKMMFYGLSYLKNFSITFIVIAVIPFFVNLVTGSFAKLKIH